MGVRTLIAGTAGRVAKVFGPGVPAAMEAGEAAAQMTPASPFSPGEPIGPFDGFSRQPRSQDFATGVNIATRPRTHERVSFETLRGLIEAYDVAQIAIWHRIDSLRGMDWKLIAADNYNGDVTDAIPLGLAALRKPDHVHGFKAWFAKWMYDVLAYDAGSLYRLRNRGGKCIGLMPVDGTTIAPLLDYWGNPPGAMAAAGEPLPEAYVQFVQGLPWNWLTRDDLIYEPFRPRNNSPYGNAPLETIILNANTDIRFQTYFLQRFTAGNIPEAFASAPETWSPDQIEQFQAYWDSFMYGDQSQKHQIKWMPGGSTLAWSNEKDFTDTFSLFLMRKSCAAYHVVPTDLGFTENSNYSTGESQGDVQHRVGELPLMEYAEDILSRFVYDDLGLPLKFEFDRGEDQDDRLVQAQADQTYIDRAVVSPSEIREMRFGLPEPAGKMVPRVFFTSRAGPIPLNSLYAVAGEVDPENAAPVPGAPLPQQVFSEVEGVLPVPPLVTAPLAEREFGPSAMPPSPPPQPPSATPPVATMPARKEAAAPAGGEGITTGTGITSYDLVRDEDDDEDQPSAAVVKAELAAFRRFRQSRRRAGAWRDFTFTAVDPVRAHNLNDAGRLAVRKAAGEVAVAGLAVLAADTGRVLMLQRALSDDDPAAGTWEFPGGHLEGDESPLRGAWREWSEETGSIPPPGTQTGSWASPDGIYQGIVWTVDTEASVPVRCETFVANPDDPDGDSSEAIAWWDPATLPGNGAVRPELLADIGAVMAALGCGDDDCCGADCCAGGCCDGAGGCTCSGDVAKAAPKEQAPDGATQQSAQQAWPGWNLDLDDIAYWVPILAAALTGALSASDLAGGWLAQGASSDASTKPERIKDLTGQAEEWLSGREDGLEAAITDTVRGVRTDGYAIGAASASTAADAEQAGHLGSVAADMGEWQPGASSVARELVGSLGGTDGLRDLLRESDVTIRSIAANRLSDLARVLADGAARGASAEEMAEAITGLLSDPSRARMIVGTELARAVNSAAMWTYRFHGIEQVRWTSADDGSVCSICLANEAAGPIPLGEAFPSGDVTPPGHPRCRCAAVPA